MSKEEIETFEIESSDPFEHQKERKAKIEYFDNLDRSTYDELPIKLTYSTLHPNDRKAFDALYAHMRDIGYKYGHLPRDSNFLKLFQCKGDRGIKALFDDTMEDKNRVINHILSTRPEKQLLQDGYYRVCQIRLTHFYNKEAEVMEITYEDVFPILGKFEELLHLQLINPVHERIYTKDMSKLRRLYLDNLGEIIFGTTKPWRNYHMFSQPKILDESVFLSDIRTLTVTRTPIYEFPDLAGDQLSNMLSIEFQYLTFSNGIDNLGKYAHKFPNLYRLSLCDTVGVKTIPKGLSKLSNLNEFEVFDNTLEYIASDLATVQHLIYVHIKSNKLNVNDPFLITLINVLYKSRRLIVSISFEANSSLAAANINSVSEQIKKQLEALFIKQNEINRYYANISDDVWIQMNKRAYDLMIKYSRQVSLFDHKIYTYFTNIALFGFIDRLLKDRGHISELYIPATENWGAFTLYFGPIKITPDLDELIYPVNDNPKDPRY
jgi:hypothetical protein